MKAPILLFLYFVAFTAAAQRFVEPDKMKSFNITVNYPDYTVKAQMLKEPKKMHPDAELTYHWYTSQKIMETKGGFDGKLLHGTYRSFYLNDQLFESGEFKYGVKTGEWRTWYGDGKLKEICHWKNGRKNGHYALYSDYGKLLASGTFRRDLLTGTFTTYDASGNVSAIRKYRKGKEVLKREKAQKVKKQKAEPTEKPVEKRGERKGFFGKKKKSTPADGKAPEMDKDKVSPKDTNEHKTPGQKFKSLFRKKPKANTAAPASKTAVNT